MCAIETKGNTRRKEIVRVNSKSGGKMQLTVVLVEPDIEELVLLLLREIHSPRERPKSRVLAFPERRSLECKQCFVCNQPPV